MTDQDRREYDQKADSAQVRRRLLSMLDAEQAEPASQPGKTRTLPILPEDLKRAIQETGLVEDVPDDIRSTVSLRPEKRRELPDGNNPYGYNPDALEYVRLPRNPSAQRTNLPVWRIALQGLGTVNQQPLGVELVGDVVMGLDRGDGGAPDLDLMCCDGLMHGVSRRHALLRPTQNRLYLVDLDSTNGTMHNALPLVPGHAPELRHGDIITLGSLSFTLRIVQGPSKPQY